jgi:undecaprenyl diphosphate synthase
MLDLDRIPHHIAIVMDGNGRWASKRGLPRIAGHNAGMQAMKETIKKASALGVKHLTVYAFSTENWKRSKDEVKGIFNLISIYVEKELAELHRNRVKVFILGEYELLPSKAVESLRKALDTTADNTGMQFNIALNYGSRAEMIRGVKEAIRDCVAGKCGIDDINDEMISSKLYTAGIPDPELIIRTSGEKRLSNFLLWQCAYSELVFTDVLWPEFTPEELEKAIMEYQNRRRRFGGRKT